MELSVPKDDLNELADEISAKVQEAIHDIVVKRRRKQAKDRDYRKLRNDHICGHYQPPAWQQIQDPDDDEDDPGEEEEEHDPMLHAPPLAFAPGPSPPFDLSDGVPDAAADNTTHSESEGSALQLTVDIHTNIHPF